MKKTLMSFLRSSQDPSEIGNKVKGFVLLLSGVIIFGASQVFNVTLSANDVITLGTGLGTVAGALWTVYGVLLHLITFFGSKKSV